jgi:hypothetical protein
MKRLQEVMRDFDVADIETSMQNLLLAAEQADNIDPEHPPGFYARPNNAIPN